jgi:hypothetical protein
MIKEERNILIVRFKMEDFLSGPALYVLVAGVLILIFACWGIRQYHKTQNEIARYENFIRDHSSKPVRGEIEYYHVFSEYGGFMQLFKKGTIVFDDDDAFLTENESAFHHTAKQCLEKDPNFMIHHQQEIV